MDNKNKMLHGYICRKCALEKGASATKGHVCTTHQAECPYCNEMQYLSHLSDWNWPDKKALETNMEI